MEIYLLVRAPEDAAETLGAYRTIDAARVAAEARHPEWRQEWQHDGTALFAYPERGPFESLSIEAVTLHD